jgi:hypothetical protein
MAAVLTHNDNFNTVALQKGIQSPFGMQQDLSQILNGMILPNGQMDLDPSEMIILFELGATNAASPAFDFNDLVLLVRTECPVATEVVLRDSIEAPDTLMTNGNDVVATSSNGTSFQYVVAQLTPTQDVRLTMLTSVLGSTFGTTPPITWSSFGFRINVWDSAAARSASPSLGNVVRCNFSHASNASPGVPPPAFGVSRSIFGTMTSSFLAEFDLQSGIGGSCTLNQLLVEGTTYQITVAPRLEISGGNPGGIGTVISTESGASDSLAWGSSAPGSIQPLPDFYSQHSGRVGYKLVGIPE